MSYHKSPWQEAADTIQGVEGLHLKCVRGAWLADEVAVNTGPTGVKIAVIMPSALHGMIRFENGKPTGRKPIRYEDAPPPVDETLPDGWNALTEVLAVGVDEQHLGQLMTFTNAGWGGRRAFGKLIKLYVRKGEQEFPVCTLSSRDRGDINNNVEPVFEVVAWAPRDRFSDLLPPETPRLIQQVQAGRLSPPDETGGPQQSSPPPSDYDDGYGGHEPDDYCPF